MKSRRLPLLFVTLGFLGSLAVLLLRAPQSVAPTAPNAFTPSPFPDSVVCVPEHESPAGLKTGESAARRLPATAPRAAVAVQSRGPAPDSTRAAYPGQTELPWSWHEFSRALDKLTVAPYPDLPLTFERTAVKDEGNYVTWFGTVREIPGSSLVSVATPGGGFHSVLVVPGSSQFAFSTNALGETTITESQPGEEGCAIGALPNRSTAEAPTTSALFKAQYTGALASYSVNNTYSGSSDETAVGTAALNADALQIGVLCLYDAGTLAAAGSADTVDGRSKSYIEFANVALAQSGVVNFQWKYLGAVAVNITRPAGGSTEDDDLLAISSGTVGNFVSAQAYKYGAAQVFLWRDKNVLGGVASGVASTGGKGVPVASAAAARSLGLWDTSYKVMVHELAHNFGCQHDRAHANRVANSSGTTADPEGNGHYAYGTFWRTFLSVESFAIPAGSTRQDFANGNVTLTRPDGSQVFTWSKDMGYGTAVFGETAPDGSFTVTNTHYNTASTIMGYGSAVIPYFSNPSITVHVTSALADQNGGTGDWGTVPLGYPVADPKAAYNAKVLTDNAAAIAAFGAAIAAPAITTQPRSITVTSGSSFTLDVTATGGGLAYQWSKDGTAVSAATAASYVATASTATAGTYSVVISNLAGTVTSDTVTVTVTAATPTPSPSTGGGGGGGGAPSHWFLATLFLLTLARFGRRSFLRL